VAMPAQGMRTTPLHICSRADRVCASPHFLSRGAEIEAFDPGNCGSSALPLLDEDRSGPSGILGSTCPVVACARVFVDEY
jgi:hypothetical protein